jgi:dynein heavy chain
MFDLIQDYQTLFERRMEGLLLGEGIRIFYPIFIIEAVITYKYFVSKTILLNFIALDEAMKTFDEAKKIATSKSYDYLDPRNTDFDTDYDNFMANTDALKGNIGEIIEKNYADVWETPQGIRFLTRFEKVKIYTRLSQKSISSMTKKKFLKRMSFP